MWRQQRFIAGFMVVVGLITTPYLIYKGLLFTQYNYTFALYIPFGLLLGGGFLYYKYRSFVEAQDEGLVISTLSYGMPWMPVRVVIEYDKIRMVRVQPLTNAFLDARRRMVVPVVKTLIDKPAFFVRVRGTDEELDYIRRKLGTRIAYDDMVALPVADPDAVAWGVNARLPEKLGQNLGGSRRKKRR